MFDDIKVWMDTTQQTNWNNRMLDKLGITEKQVFGVEEEEKKEKSFFEKIFSSDN
jgi:hypothetical protein